MVKRFLSGLRADPRPLHAWKWRELLGVELADALRAERILFDAGLAAWFPCGGHCHRRRVVLDEGKPADRPFVAPCAIDRGCEDARLTHDDLRMLAQDFGRLLEVLRDRLGIEPVGQSGAFVIEDVVRVGQLARRGVPTDVFLALRPDEGAFPMFLGTRACAPRETLVLVADARALPDSALAGVGPTSRIDVVLLEDVLTLRDGRLVAKQELVASSTAVGAPPGAAPAALMLSDDGERALSADAYAALVDGAPEDLDLFLDVATLQRAGRKRFYDGGGRSGKRYKGTQLTETEGRAVAEFIMRARQAPLAPTELGALQGKSAEQIFKTGWGRVDPTRRFIVRDGDGYRFVPPPGTRWALVRPVTSD